MVRLAFVACLIAACSGAPGGPSINNRVNPPEMTKPASRVVTVDILKREPRASRTRVKHILIGWADKAGAYNGNIDKRAAGRTLADAESVVDALMEQIASGGDFDALMRATSEDSGLASNPNGYEVKPDANLVLEFRQLGLRLEVGEVGVVESDFGFHVMKREE
jgi:peptidyl-prolyl cis-trans isomerase D